ncbi:hypothetical protein R1flu_029074 [Riccia fluitans]|uniref:Uncharacterized protein n=1 Tax=Riccia fluitans TaxID=41844 RepID=A0ABD1XRE1_9MARC
MPGRRQRIKLPTPRFNHASSSEEVAFGTLAKNAKEPTEEENKKLVTVMEKASASDTGEVSSQVFLLRSTITEHEVTELRRNLFEEFKELKIEDRYFKQKVSLIEQKQETKLKDAYEQLDRFRLKDSSTQVKRVRLERNKFVELLDAEKPPRIKREAGDFKF